jgi:hypothetical protein
VAQIEDPRRRRAPGDDDTKLGSQLTESVADRLASKRVAVRHAEHRAIRDQYSMSSATSGEILADSSSQSRTKRNEAILAELGLDDRQDSAIPIDVAKAKPTHLAHAEPECVERREDRTIRGPSELSAVRIGQLARVVEQSLDVFRIENDGESKPDRATRSRLNWRPVDHPARGQPPEQNSQYAEELVVAACPSMRPLWVPEILA